MKDDASHDDLLLEFDKRKELYDDFLVMILRLFGEFIKENALDVHSFVGNIISREALHQHLLENPWITSLDEIEHLASIQILSFFEEDVKMIIDVLDAEFTILKRSDDVKESRDPRRFGYQSKFCLLRMMNARLEWIEYRRFKQCKVKVQICSLLQHAWAQIRDRLDIAEKESLPPAHLRPAARVVGMFELADRELNQLKNALSSQPSPKNAADQPAKGPAPAVSGDQPEQQLEERADAGPAVENPPIATTTGTVVPSAREEVAASTVITALPVEFLIKLILDEALVRNADRQIADLFDTRLKFDDNFIFTLNRISSRFHIQSKEQLLDYMKKYEQTILDHSKSLLGDKSKNQTFLILRGFSLLMMFHALANDTGLLDSIIDIDATIKTLYEG